LKLVFHIAKDKAVTMDSPDQGAYGIECNTVYLSSDSINVKVPSLRVNYAGHLTGDNIEGTFKQGMMKLPLVLEPGENKAKRPQTPVAPFPYTTEDVKISNSDNSVVLAGTLTIPENATKKTPIVVMVTGSGLQNRDEELFEHKPFAVIADYLARNGIASLRYDDRGFGESTGDATQATTADFASDAKAVVDWIHSQRRFGKIGIIGHSEGGQIAYILGAKKHGPDFIVSIAGPSIKGTKTIAYQNKIALLKSAIPQQQAEDFETAIEKVLDYKLTHPNQSSVADTLVAELYPQHNDDLVTRQLATAIKTSLTTQDANPWMTYFLAYDPANDMKALKIPTLIIYGEKDRQVPPSLNAAPARKFAPKATVKEYPGLNHLMQHAVTGDVEEYKTIEETISPEVLSDIVNFIKSVKK
ncbi:MAG: lysophospholipase, partial [Muribaculaceae bacterium]|nr:lysophospholipase [Muribaculaceae bacterium]